MYVLLKLLTIFITAIFSLTSCNIVNSLNIQEKTTHLKDNFTIDVGKGKLGGNISFKVKISEGFKIKNNKNGFNSLYDSINSYKIALVTSAGTGSNSLTTLPNGNSSDIYSINKVDLSRTQTSPDANIYLQNVPAGSYWVAVSAYDSDGRNITATTSTTGKIGTETFSVSTGGGNQESSPNNGRVTVAADFTIPSTPVTIPMTLVDSYGATIEATVDIDAGTNPLTNIQFLRFYLVDSNTDNSNLVDSNIKKGPFDISSGTLFTNLVSGTPTTVKFVSVPTGTTYHIAVAAYNSTSPVDNSTNITNLLANNNVNITITSNPTPTGNMGTFSVSNGGGNSNLGSVSVDSNYQVNSPTPVTVTLQLL